MRDERARLLQRHAGALWIGLEVEQQQIRRPGLHGVQKRVRLRDPPSLPTPKWYAPHSRPASCAFSRVGGVGQVDEVDALGSFVDHPCDGNGAGVIFLQQDFWPHVYNELPVSGTRTNRLQVITGSIESPEAVQVTRTIRDTKLEPNGDRHISFQPDDPGFPHNHDAQEPPLEVEIIYAGPVSQPDAVKASKGFKNPFASLDGQLKAGTRLLVAGPLIFDTAHGKVSPNGDVQYGLEIHPAVAVTLLSNAPGPTPGPLPGDGNSLSEDLASALGQASGLRQTTDNPASLVQKMTTEAPTS